MRLLVMVLILLSWGLASQAQAREKRYEAPFAVAGNLSLSGSDKDMPQEVTVYSTADIELAGGVIKDFRQLHPTITVIYHEMQSLELYHAILRESDAGQPTADLAFSSAMDLQMKLANDGYAAQVSVPSEEAMPDWAIWRHEAFGVTFEPSVIVYNKPYFLDYVVPKNRAALIDFLQERHPGLQGGIATYDIEASGLGFLFLARDADQYSATWELVRAMGANRVQLSPSSTAIIEGVASGKYKLAYNVLGSYAAALLASHPDLGIILPEDYTLVFSRIALIPKAARSKQAGELLLDYLLSERGQKMMAETAHFNAIHPGVRGPFTAEGLISTGGNNLRPIKVAPSLLVYLDQVKRRKILKQWYRALEGQ